MPYAPQDGTGEGETMKPTMMVRLWSLQNVFLLWLTVRRSWSSTTTALRRPRPSQLAHPPPRHPRHVPRHLCMGADVAAG